MSQKGNHIHSLDSCDRHSPCLGMGKLLLTGFQRHINILQKRKEAYLLLYKERLEREGGETGRRPCSLSRCAGGEGNGDGRERKWSTFSSPQAHPEAEI